MKRGQLELSFGMIFSIVLIIVFIVFAGYAIKMIIDLQGTASVGSFINDLQNDVNKMWAGSGGSQKEDNLPNLPNNIDKICFKDGLVSFHPFGSGGKFEDEEIEHLDKGNSFCADVVDGKVKIRIKKGDDESLVSIEAGE